MVGKIVEIKTYNGSTKAKVVDVILVSEKVECDISSGKGGTTRGTIPVSVTAYMVAGENGSVKIVEANKIIGIIE